MQLILHKSNGAAILLLHIADPDSLVNDPKRNLSFGNICFELVKEERFLTGIKLQVYKEGKVADLILEESRTNDVDLVVSGTQEQKI
ncbi:MAG: universal stress protein [Bacteroidetes bacterium]|nr:universal stress protein [Bacteroidota bacterium]